MLTKSRLLLLPVAIAVSVLNSGCAPGCYFDLSNWSLQLPIGSVDNPTAINSSSLQGCSGYQNCEYFFTELGDNALVMKVPGSPSSSGCVTTPNSKHCRTELREANPTSWYPNATTNKLSATLAVTNPDDSKHGTVVGQIHIDDSVSTTPVCELYYNSTGVISMGVEQTRSGGDQIYTEIGTVPVGTTFSYVISYAENVLGVSINNGTVKVLSTYDLDMPLSYFKVGNYNQGNSASTVKFYAINVAH